MMSNFVISERERGAGRNRFSPNRGEIKYSMWVSSKVSGKYPKIGSVRIFKSFPI